MDLVSPYKVERSASLLLVWAPTVVWCLSQLQSHRSQPQPPQDAWRRAAGACAPLGCLPACVARQQHRVNDVQLSLQEERLGLVIEQLGWGDGWQLEWGEGTHDAGKGEKVIPTQVRMSHHTTHQAPTHQTGLAAEEGSNPQTFNSPRLHQCPAQ